MSESTKKYLEIIDAATELSQDKESAGDKIKGALETLFKGLYNKRKKENVEWQAFQLAETANIFDSIHGTLDDIYKSFPSAELDEVNKIGMDAFLNNFAEEQFNNTDWSQRTGIKWEDRTNPARVTTADQEKMIGLFDGIKLNKKDQMQNLQQKML